VKQQACLALPENKRSKKRHLSQGIGPKIKISENDKPLSRRYIPPAPRNIA